MRARVRARVRTTHSVCASPCSVLHVLRASGDGPDKHRGRHACCRLSPSLGSVSETQRCAAHTCAALSAPCPRRCPARAPTQLWLGGSPNQTRLAQVYAERVKLRELEATLEPLLAAFAARRNAGEAFGDFVARVGFSALRAYAAAYVPAERLGSLPTVRLHG